MAKKKPKKKKKEVNEPTKLFDFDKSIIFWVIGGFLLLFFILFIYATLQPVPPPETSIYREPLAPVVELQLSPGEDYVYELIGPDKTVVSVLNQVKERKNECMTVFVSSQNFSFPFCIHYRTGETLTSTEQGLEPGPSLEFFQPWMLALKNGWTWRVDVNTTVQLFGISEKIDGTSRYELVARGSVKGRDAYKILVHTSMTRYSNNEKYETSNRTEVIWVDVEKRVMLYGASEYSSLELVTAPFAIEPYSPE